jgi:signal transduction histidine kinase
LRSEKEIKEFEADVRNKSGEVLSCLLSAGLIELDGEPHILSVARDITEHKKALKTGHLASIGELSAGIAHEINNPTNSIMLNAEMLLDMPELEADERNDIASSIRKDSQRITNIVKSLLSFARADCKEKSPVNINTIMRDALMLTQQQIGKSGIDLTISISPDIPEITANAQEMEQVFINIINNARYALNQKYPSNNCDKKLVISASPIEIDSTPYLQLIFYDTGTGISRDIIKKVKDPFFTTKPVNAGTGLGMSISHGIISDHKGTLEIESKEGEYTRIIIKLPVEVENEPAGSFD